jgi:hypothetical protein
MHSTSEYNALGPETSLFLKKTKHKIEDDNSQPFTSKRKKCGGTGVVAHTYNLV